MADSAAGSFHCKPVPWLKEYLKQRGIQSSGKRKVELVELCEKSEEMKVPKIAEEEAPVDPRISMKEQLKTDEGDLANPLDNENRVFFQWTKNFTNVPDFRFPDVFNCLVGKDPVYNSESLKSLPKKFAVKPTEKSKTDDGSATYRGFFILKKDGSVNSAYCLCNGGYVFSSFDF